ncbi:MAG: metallophosphoesterase [Myxococcales bacterium]|nr:metallophosphoesterase [Myxococcales bacterium]
MHERPQSIRIAHLSDLHVLDLTGTAPARFLNKRVTGVANLLGARRDAHPIRIAEALPTALGPQGLDVDHVVITGDLSNLALESEFARAKQVVTSLGGPERVTVIPGNHDVYTQGALRSSRFESFFGQWMMPTPVDPADLERVRKAGRQHYPFAKTIAPGIVVYGLSSAIPAPPIFAWGEVGSEQLSRLRGLVAAEPPEIHTRIVLVHHNLHTRSGLSERTSLLRDRDALKTTLRDIDATVLLHGHTHPPQQHTLAGDGSTWILGCGSSTWYKPAHDHVAHFNVLTLGDDRGLREVQSYKWNDTAGIFERDRSDLMQSATQRPLSH